MWYSYHSIDFSTRAQIEFLVEHLPVLREGIWPKHPDGSSAVDQPSKPHVQARAYFTRPVEYAAEVEVRLQRCGQDGLMVLLHLCHGESLDTIGSYFSLGRDAVLFRMNAALNWSCGRQRKRGYDFRSRHYYGRQGKRPGS